MSGLPFSAFLLETVPPIHLLISLFGTVAFDFYLTFCELCISLPSLLGPEGSQSDFIWTALIEGVAVGPPWCADSIIDFVIEL